MALRPGVKQRNFPKLDESEGTSKQNENFSEMLAMRAVA